MARRVVSCLAALLLFGFALGCGSSGGSAQIPTEPGAVVKRGEAKGMSFGELPKTGDKKKK